MQLLILLHLLHRERTGPAHALGGVRMRASAVVL